MKLLVVVAALALMLPAAADAHYPLAEGGPPGPFAHPLTGGVPYCAGPARLLLGFAGPVYRWAASSIQANGTVTFTVSESLGDWSCLAMGWMPGLHSPGDPGLFGPVRGVTPLPEIAP